MLLAIDTSTRSIGVALYDGLNVTYEAVWASHNFHTVELGPTVAEALARAGCSARDLQALGVALGPGSFTSLRVGLAFAKGMALANRLSLVGIPTLDIVASAQPPQDMPLVAILQAGRGKIATCWYHLISGSWEPSGEVSVVTAADLAKRIRKPTLICGEVDENTRRVLRRKYKNAILSSPARSLRRPAFLAELAWDRWQAGQVDDPNTLTPFYLHKNEPSGP